MGGKKESKSDFEKREVPVQSRDREGTPCWEVVEGDEKREFNEWLQVGAISRIKEQRLQLAKNNPARQGHIMEKEGGRGDCENAHKNKSLEIGLCRLESKKKKLKNFLGAIEKIEVPREVEKEGHACWKVGVFCKRERNRTLGGAREKRQ